MRYFLLIATLAFGGNTWSQKTKETIPPIPNKTEGADKSKDDAQSKQTIPIELPSTINVTVGSKLELKSEQNNPERHEEPIKWSEWLVAIFTGLLVFVTGYLVHYTKKLWGSTATLVIDAKETGRKELRAYVGVERFELVTDDLKDRVIGIKIQNYGKTPAHNISLTYFAQDEEPVTPPPYPAGLLTHGLGMFSPSQGYIHTSDIAPARYIAIVGFIAYEDIFGVTWETHFCYEFQWIDTRVKYTAYKKGNYEQCRGENKKTAA